MAVDVSENYKATITFDKCKEQNKTALAETILFLDKAKLKNIFLCATSKKAWKKLQSIHALKGQIQKIELLTDSKLFQMNKNDDFRERLGKFLSALEQLQEMRDKILKNILVGRINTQKFIIKLQTF